MIRLLPALAALIPATVPARDSPAPWTFRDSTAEVLDQNSPGLGSFFDYALVDLNHDHLLDIVVNKHHRSKPSPIWLGTPDHKFRFWRNPPPARIPIAGFHLGEVDQNGDGRTDLVYTGNEGGVIIDLNDFAPGTREPTFQPIHIPSSSHLVSLVDFDADGHLETLVRPGSIYRGLEAPPTTIGMQFGNWVAADFDHDGWPDLFAAGEDGRRAHWNGPHGLFRSGRRGDCCPRPPTPPGMRFRTTAVHEVA